MKEHPFWRVLILSISACLSAHPNGLRGVQAEESPRLAEERIVLRTSGGDIVLALYPDVAPQHVEQILKLTRLGVYDGLHFPRIDPGFVAQISTAYDRRTPLTEAQRSSIHPLAAEFSNLKHRRGIVSLAHADHAPDSGETSFSILLGEAPHLDGQYTIFGEVERGMEVLDEFQKVPRRGTTPVVKIEVLRGEVAESSAALAEMQIAGPQTIPVPAEAVPVTTSEHDLVRRLMMANGLLVIGMIVVCGIQLTVFGLGSRISRSRAQSLNLVCVMIGGFLLFVILTPDAARHAEDPASHRYFATAIFVVLLTMLKLMGRFELPE